MTVTPLFCGGLLGIFNVVKRSNISQYDTAALLADQRRAGLRSRKTLERVRGLNGKRCAWA